MPPKRKALSEAPSNASNARPKPRATKSAKTSKVSAAAKVTAKINTPTTKYCNANTLSKEPIYSNLQWANIADFAHDKNQDMPAKGQLIDEFCHRTSDLGFPLSKDGAKICLNMDKEMDKRNQDRQDMYIYNDWNGWGMREVWENLLADFNRDIYKKTLSPYEKYAYIEAIAAFVKGADLNELIHNEDGESVAAVVEFLGIMILTVYDMLKEHNLLASSTPESKIKNLETVTLILIEFLLEWGVDLDCHWGCEIIRCVDEAGINLQKSLRKQIAVSKNHIAKYRKEYKIKKEESKYAKDEDNGDGYATFAKLKNWSPDNDKGEDGMKMFYRWDWKKEYINFRKEHSGGKKYDLTKLSKAERKEYTLL